jgi:5'-nucleotidase (lipoprotein e(P4) family)
MKKLIIVAGIIMLASCVTLKHKTEPPAGNQDALILATLWYQKSAEMRALYYQCFRNAEISLGENLAHPGRTKPAAVVLDIDETLLDNSPFQGWQVIENKPYNNEDWHRWVDLAQAAALPGAVEFTRFADSLEVEVFYVSNRTAGEMGPTIQNMAARGFVNADTAHMLLKETVSSKAGRRAEIGRDYEIILLVGDNLADLSTLYENRGADNGYASVDNERSLFGTRYIILPNPMYGDWLNDLLRNTAGNPGREKYLRLLEKF